MRMTDRAIEVDEQSADGRGHERRPEGPRHGARHDQRTGIVPTVGVQKRSSPPKQPSIGRRNPVAAVFTRDKEGIDHGAALVTSAARASGETPVAYLRPIRG